ncbi:MAG: hypothetical protein JJU48_02885 [Methylophaga sp.]|nr:hypothetical protein [Methylophaga sp.]
MDLSDSIIHPIDAVYMAHQSIPVIQVPITNCRGFQIVGFNFSYNHPFVNTLIALKNGKCSGYQGSPLQKYHQLFQPADAFDVLGLSEKFGSDRLRSLTPLEAVLPWWPDIGHLMPENRPRAILSTAKKEIRSANLPPSIQPAMYWYGPFSNLQGEAEIKRLFDLYHKIDKHGFQRNNNKDGDICGAALVRPDGSFRILLNGGEHRAAITTALGYAQIPVRLYSPVSRNIILRADVEKWPQVRSGLFSVSQALMVFDRIFEGRPSSDGFKF